VGLQSFDVTIPTRPRHLEASYGTSSDKPPLPTRQEDPTDNCNITASNALRGS
jgi:hypothetical protein